MPVVESGRSVCRPFRVCRFSSSLVQNLVSASFVAVGMVHLLGVPSMLPQKGIHLKQRQRAMLCCRHWLVAYSVCEKILVALPTCAKLADMLLTKRTYTCLGGGLTAKSA